MSNAAGAPPYEPAAAQEPSRPAEIEVVEGPDESTFGVARRLFASPPPAQTGGFIYLVLFVVFLLSNYEGMKSLPGLAILVGVLLFHEGGHALGMRLFGYRDVRVYFIPFFGAAASGRARGAAAWKEAIVSLLGPMPGVLVGAVLYIVVFAYFPFEWLLDAARVTLLLNGFNLLPFGGLDGGRFLQRVVFSRHRLLEVGFLVLGSLALGAVALAMSAYMLLAFAAIGLVAVPARYRTLGGARAIRLAHPRLPSDPDHLGEAETRALFDAAHGVFPAAQGLTASALAAEMTAIHEATRPPPGRLASLGLLGLYALSWMVVLVGTVMMAMDGAPPEFRVVETAGFHVEFPQRTIVTERSEPTPAGERSGAIHLARVNHLERFNVQVIDAGQTVDPIAWRALLRDRMARDTRTTVTAERAVMIDGREGFEVEFRNGYRVVRSRGLFVGNRAFLATTSAPRWGDTEQRFLDSFRVVAPGGGAATTAPPP